LLKVREGQYTCWDGRGAPPGSDLVAAFGSLTTGNRSSTRNVVKEANPMLSVKQLLPECLSTGK